MDLKLIIQGILDIAASAAEKTPGRTDDMVIALIRSLIQKFAPEYASAGPESPLTAFRNSLDAEDQAALDSLLAGCDCDDDCDSPCEASE